MAVTKILAQWEELKLHFQIARTPENCYGAELLYNMYTATQLKGILYRISETSAPGRLPNNFEVLRKMSKLSVSECLHSKVIPGETPHYLQLSL
jgi:hypothetical protein